MMVLYYISAVQVASCSQEGSTCSSQRCNCEVNNGVILQTLIEAMVNQSLNERLPASVEEAVESKFQAVQQQLNDTIDKKIADIQQDIPGKELAYTIIFITASIIILLYKCMVVSVSNIKFIVIILKLNYTHGMIHIIVLE